MRAAPLRFAFCAAVVLGACAKAGLPTTDDGGTTCSAPSLVCGAICVEPSNDPDNCGACGNACGASEVCSNGKCGSSCSAGTLCTPDGGKAICANTSTDTKNCGSCGNACGNGQTCTNGKCTGGNACSGTQTACPGDGGTTCVDTQTDPNHCGNCATACLPNLQLCTEGACASACTGGKTLCVPDGGAGDGGPVAHCADLQNDTTDCGSCFAACPGGATCTAGKCVSTLLGSGTAADPWHTATALANCAAYKTQFPAAQSGVYTTHPNAADIGVYCDMTAAGVTYEDFGMGQYSKTYTGYAWIGGTDFSGSAQLDAAFAYLFTRNGGLTNIDIGFTSSNCCFLNSNGTNEFGVAGATYMYPGQGSSFTCNPSGGYTATIIPLYLVTANTTISSITSAQAGSVGYYSACSVAGNPGIFVKRY